MFRKHWEAYLGTLKRTWWYDIFVIQTDNAFWEGSAKLLVIGLSCLILGRGFLIGRKKRVLGLSCGIGLGYGLGEAFLLAFLMLYPAHSRFFGLQTFGAFLTTGFAYERFWAIQSHALMGGIIGVGVYRYLCHGRKRNIVFFLILAMAYHTLIDGSIILIRYYPAFIRYYPPPVLFMPFLALLGYCILFAAYKKGAGKCATPT